MLGTRHLLFAALLFTTSGPVLAQHVVATDTANLLGVDDAEFTPDGRFIVARDNTELTTSLVYDAQTGALLFSYKPPLNPSPNNRSGPVEDAVVTTDDRAVVIGSTIMILDLNNLGAGVPMAEHSGGLLPRDLAVTPDGTIVAVRGGQTVAGSPGGQFLFDMASGALLAQGPGEPAAWNATAFGVDSVVVDDEHAVFTSIVVGPATRVTVWELHPSGGGPPAVVFETIGALDQAGIPHDIAMTPDGQHVAVRSDLALGLYRLDGVNTQQLWVSGLKGDPGPFGGSAMDSLEVTNHRIVTISRRSNLGTGALLDLFELDGTRRFAFLTGDPHDLALTPNGSRAVIRTHNRVYLFDIRSLPTTEFILPLDETKFVGTHTSWDAGLDSIVANDTRVAGLSRNLNDTRLRVWDISNDTLDKVFSHLHPDKPVDLELTPDGTRVVLGCWTSLLVVDLRTNQIVLDFDSSFSPGATPWCDGVAIRDDKAVAFGVTNAGFGGWITLIDLFDQPTRFCTSTRNSTGQASSLVVSGSGSFAANDLVLWATGLPSKEMGIFFYADGQTSLPIGDGFLCLAGQIARFPVQVIPKSGLATLPIDNGNLPLGGGALFAGSSWGFQFMYRDTSKPASTGFNLSDAVTVDFTN